MTQTTSPTITGVAGTPSTVLTKIKTRGTIISTGATSAYLAIPTTLAGTSPNFLKLTATAACYARLGLASDATAVIAAAGTGYLIGDPMTVSGGTSSVPMVLSVATSKLISTVGDTLGSGYDVADVITLLGGTAATKATITLSHVQLASMTSNAAGTGYVPGQTLTTAGTGSTAGTHATLTVTHTQAVSATVAAAGTGNLGDGAGVIVVGTTGTGTKFRASVTISTNAIASVQSISVAGDYTVNPTTIATEPVTYVSGAASGSTLTGAQLSVVMGMLTATVLTKGDYTVKASALTQNGATNPSGATGATWSTPLFGPLTWTYSEPGIYSLTSTTLTQTTPAPASGGTGATFKTSSYGVLTATVTNGGVYSVDPTNPVSTTSTGAGTGATFTLTMTTAAAAGDLLVQPGDAVFVDSAGYDHVVAIRVTADGVLQIQPIENVS
jgi:hypothetical protein